MMPFVAILVGIIFVNCVQMWKKEIVSTKLQGIASPTAKFVICTCYTNAFRNTLTHVITGICLQNRVAIAIFLKYTST